MPTPIWEGKKTKNEVVRFNHAGYICPMHNYEAKTLELQDSGSLASEWLTGGFWSQNGCINITNMSGEHLPDYSSQQIHSSCLSGLSNHTNLCCLGKRCELHRLFSSQHASAESSVGDCGALI